VVRWFGVDCVCPSEPPRKVRVPSGTVFGNVLLQPGINPLRLREAIATRRGHSERRCNQHR
jgi:hypothetical protein